LTSLVSANTWIDLRAMGFKDLEMFEIISADCILDQLNIEYTIPDKEIIKCKDRWIELQ
jgi:hypothetical protein